VLREAADHGSWLDGAQRRTSWAIRELHDRSDREQGGPEASELCDQIARAEGRRRAIWSSDPPLAEGRRPAGRAIRELRDRSDCELGGGALFEI
jgi:hypothetical protein